MVTFTTWVGTKAGVEEKTVTRPDLTGHQAFIKTTHSGLCGSDVHFRHAGIGMGHEGAGVVKELGPEVTNLKVGDRVAWGWINGSCRECPSCLAGYVNICSNGLKQYSQTDTDQGSFSTGAVWDSRFVFKIPDSMASEDAAPLMCGAWCVWNALIGYDLKPSDHIGIVGIGGLGHFAIQLANKMGCEVTVFSRTESKKAESLALGAHHFIATKDAKSLKVARPIDRLLVTTNAHIDWDLYEPVIAGRGSVFPLQIPDWDSKLSVPHMPFLLRSINVIYSTNGRHDSYDKLLAFCALHDIKPISEKFPMTAKGIEESIEKLNRGEMRYRGVLIV